MAQKFTLTVQTRSETGKGAARKIRAAARVPGVLYGKGEDPIPVSLDRRDFIRTVTGHSVSNMVLDLTLDADAAVKALIREIQVDPVSNEVVHVDLNRISLTEKMEFEIPLELVGVPTGVKDFGGILANPRRAITVLCLANDVPDKITVDVSGLGLGDVFHVSDLAVQAVEVVTPGHLTIAAVSAPSTVAEPGEGEEEAGAEGEGAAGEGEGAEKKEDGED
jgi:large subunit ribosomal protein L25